MSVEMFDMFGRNISVKTHGRASLLIFLYPLLNPDYLVSQPGGSVKIQILDRFLHFFTQLLGFQFQLFQIQQTNVILRRHGELHRLRS